MKTILVWIGAALVLAASACGDDRPPAAGSGESIPPPTGTGPVVQSDAGDAGEAESDPALCEGLEQKSQDVEEYTVPGPAPAPIGGDIPAGTYVLNELAEYDDASSGGGGDPPAPGPTGKLARSTLYVTKTTMRLLESRGSTSAALPADAARAFSYTRSGTELDLADVCPTQAASTRGYSVHGNLLTFHVDATHTEVYRITK